ncbi:SDR family NAD(P)-dependent oxidoreductase [Paramicrobacterium fandaimingii]|uniref:SDR family NAD(P)-dependent oxidoreductase n=1 Tax=Paramicrobacterium fandaimingii TaxID=2708079 RepID=UPI00141E713C|nr:SDR family NAD(P)-dependent oxidoreductase [Microbacterium fandaimingii]
MQIDFTGKVVVITGAATGIGREIARRFKGEGATVVPLDVNVDGLRALATDFPGEGWDNAGVVCDVRDTDGVHEAIDGIVAAHGRIDVLVNNAGVNAVGLVENLERDVWDRCFDINVRGVFNTCKAVAPVMKNQNYGRIINAASFAAIMPSIGASAYAASKAAVVQFSRTLAGELGPWGITVNSYAPGMIPTAMNGFADLPDGEQSKRLDMLTVRRWGKPDDIADLLCFLASDFAGYITGTLTDVSGGKFSTQAPSRAYREN